MSDRVPMTMSGFCQFPSSLHDSHVYCALKTCTCPCHKEET